MADKARTWTDDRLKEIEERIRDTYKEAQSYITEEWNAYMKRGQEKLSALYDAYQNAPDGQKQAAKEKYQKALRDYTFHEKKYNEMLKDTALRLANVNQIAIQYLNGELPQIYQVNFNEMDPDVQKLGINFTLVDESTVRRMILDGDIELPYKDLDIPKDMRWNTKKMNSSVLQGLLSGESMDKIAMRLLPIIGNNRAAAIRNARTMVTGAENRGRQDRYQDLESQGVIMSKIWIATPDGRTRDWHISMDGQEVEVKDYFIDGLGNELEYPGDPGAPGETVYNCRCSMRSSIKGVRGKDGKAHYIIPVQHNGLHQQQIAEERRRR